MPIPFGAVMAGNRNPQGEEGESLLRCARTVSEILGPDSCALIGGLALSAFGYVRGTLDADFISGGEPMAMNAALRNKGIESQLTWGDPDDPLPWVIRGEVGGVSFDILPQIAGTRVERGTFLPDLGITVCSVEDFIALKCFAGGPQDLADIANLIGVRSDLRSIALQVAGVYGLSERLLPFLAPS
jgi:hypothetical protein